MQTLIQIQDAALQKLAEPRTSVKRHRKYVKRVVFPWYIAQIAKVGITGDAAIATWRDVKDVATLNATADE